MYIKDKVLYLLTETFYGSGDFFAAKKLIQILSHSKPRAIYWFVTATPDRADITRHIDACRTEFESTIQIIQLDKLQNNLGELGINTPADLILFYPTSHQISGSLFKTLSAHQAPIIHLYEYDGIEKMHQTAVRSQLIRMHSGFSHLGVHVQNYKTQTLSLPTWVNPNNTLLLSYTNQDLSSVANDASLMRYLEIALQIVPEQQSVDLVCNTALSLVQHAFVELAWNHGFSEIEYHFFRNGKIETQRVRNPEMPNKKILTVHNRFPMPHSELLALTTHAFPFMHVTGDQTLSEALSRASIDKPVFPFYQMMLWKTELYDNLITLAEAVLSKQSPFCELLNYGRVHANIDVTKFVKFWQEHQQAIYDDSKKLSHHLRMHCNFSEKIVDYLNWVCANKQDLQQVRLFSRLSGHLAGTLSQQQIEQSIQFAKQLSSPAELPSVLRAVCHFISLNPIDLTPALLQDLFTHFNLAPSEERFRLADKTKTLLYKLPIASRTAASGLLLTALRKNPHVNFFDALNRSEDMLALPSDKLSIFLNQTLSTIRNIDKEPSTLIKKILLCVSVYSDGIGDLIKFIGIHRQLMQFSHEFSVKGLILCVEEQRKTIVQLLRSSGLPLQDIHLVGQSIASKLLARTNKNLKNMIGYKDLNDVGFHHEEYALILSVATPMDLLECVRTHASKQIYIELAEVSAVSHSQAEMSVHYGDRNHHFFTMGLTEEDIGLEFTTPKGLAPEKLIAALSPDLQKKLLNKSTAKKFLETSLFMPCYTKNDLGFNSFYFSLALAKQSNKPNLVLWLPSLPFKLTEQHWQKQARNAGFSRITHQDANGNSSSLAIPAAIGTKTCHIITGPINPDDFDILFELASHSSGFAGCSGQNSFEKAISFDLVPSCIMPKHQIVILMQADTLARDYFGESSAHYKIIHRYLMLLADISREMLVSNQLSASLGKEPLSHRQLCERLSALDANRSALIQKHFSQVDPENEIQQFFADINSIELKAAWQALCLHMRTTRNLNSQLSRIIKSVLVGEYRAPKKRFNFFTNLIENAVTQAITPEINPALHQQIYPLIAAIKKDKNLEIAIVLTNAEYVYIDWIPKRETLTLAFNMKALQELTLDEIRFGICLNLVAANLHIVESAEFILSTIPAEELIAGCKDHLAFAIPYCRKVLAHLQQAPNPSRSFIDSIHRNIKQFYLNFIKVVEVQFAVQYRHTLATTLTQQNSTSITNDSVTKELFHFAKIVQPPVKNRDFLDALPDFLSQLSFMQAHSHLEYHIPTSASVRFLDELNACDFDPDNANTELAISSLLQKAFEHKVAIFDRIYEWAANALQKELSTLYLGPFLTLKNCIKAFRRSHQHNVVANAQALLNFLDDPNNALLMSRSYPYHKLEKSLASIIGLQLAWKQFIESFQHNPLQISRLNTWAIQDSTQLITEALILIDHAHLVQPTLLNTISFETFDRVSKSKKIILLDDTDKRESWITSVKYSRLHMQLIPIVESISAESVLKFIQDNFSALTFHKVNSEPHALLMRYFEELHLSIQGQQLIYQFYCDPNFEYGIYKLHANLIKQFGQYAQFESIHQRHPYFSHYIADGPFFHFVFKCAPEYLPLEKIIASLADNIRDYYFQISYFYQFYKMKLHTPQDVLDFVAKLNAIPLSASTGSSAIQFAMSCAYYDMLSNVHFPLSFFSKIHAALTKVYNGEPIFTLIFNRPAIQAEIASQELKTDLTALVFAELYRFYDENLCWPDDEVRARVSDHLLKFLDNTADLTDKRAALNHCLISVKPLGDSALNEALIKIWVEELFLQMEQRVDDGTALYRTKILTLLAPLDGVQSAWVKTTMLNRLAHKILSQQTLTEMLHKKGLLDFSDSDQKDFFNIEYLEKLIQIIANNQLEYDFIDFLRKDISRDSLNTIHLAFTKKIRSEILRDFLVAKKTKVIDEQLKMQFIFIHTLFWSVDFEKRAVLINHLLMPAQTLATIEKSQQAYQTAFQYIIAKLLPNSDRDSIHAKALLTCFLNTSNEYTRPYLLASLLTASRQSTGKVENTQDIVAKLAEALGPAGVKSGQAAHSYPATPEKYRTALAHLKSFTAIPTRAQLWELICNAVPKNLRQQIKSVDAILGGASFYLAVQVKMKSGDIRVLRLLRENAKNLANYGFAHMQAALLACPDHDIQKISPHLNFILMEATRSAHNEVDHLQAEEQYRIAKALYSAPVKSIRIAGCEYRIRIQPVQLFENGPGYQLLSKAEGMEFSALKQDAKQLNCAKAIAREVCLQEFQHILSGKAFDVDRHEGQSRMVVNPIRDNLVEITVTHYDFGEIDPQPVTPNERQQSQLFLQALVNQLAKLSFAGIFSKQTDIDKTLIEFTLSYLQEKEKTNPNDLRRIRAMFKAMTSLQDYFSIVKNDPVFNSELRGLIAHEVASFSIAGRAGALFLSASNLFLSPEESSAVMRNR